MAEPAPTKEASARKPLTEAFTAPHQVYTGGILYEPGEAFFTAEPRGRKWLPASEADALLALEKAEAAAAKARR